MSEGEPAELIQWREALRWLAFAAEDLRVAKRLTADDESVLGATAFHLQQATEKILKALLVAAAENFRRTHDIDELASLAHHHWPDLISMPFPLAGAATWYVTTRYPGVDDIPPDAKEVATALNDVEGLLTAVMRIVPAPLRNETGHL